MLEKTGFWGAQGAGCIIFANDTKKFLIPHRSAFVEEPGTWGTWGGAIDNGEEPKDAVAREVQEETGYQGSIKDILPLYVFKKDDFKYFNYLVIVETEFTPVLDWENQGFKWCDFNDWPQPIHFGLAGILNDETSYEILKKIQNDY